MIRLDREIDNFFFKGEGWRKPNKFVEAVKASGSH